MITSAESYLSQVGRGTPQVGEASGADSDYATALEHAFAAWGALQSELDRLLRKRIDTLLNRLYSSLILTGALALLGIVIALLTYRHIVGPLERLAGVARTVQETKDYNLRADHSAKDEIGQLASAFNDMMSELAAARGREAAEQARATALHSELARVARLKTMGAMAASIAHEISQPLGAIVANGSAGLRWLAHAVPDLDEARAALKRIVSDGHRAGNVIKSVRTMVKAERGERAALAINDLIEEILALVRSELRGQQILVRTELGINLPDVVADRVQLQQVLLNLIVNAAEAMSSITDRSRTLDIKSALNDGEKILVTVADSGPGIDPQHGDRIFDVFFSTKSSGMGMGLSICRSIVESHGGRLWVSPGLSHGAIFNVLIPINADQA